MDNDPTSQALPRGPSTDEWLGVNLRAHLRTVRKRRYVVAFLVAITVCAAFVWTYYQPKIYQATCTVIIDPMAPQVLQGVKEVVELGTGSFWANREFYETQFRIMSSMDTAVRVVDKLGLHHDPDFPVPGATAMAPHRTIESVAGSIMGQMQVTQVKDSRIANIMVSDRDPARAARIANAIAQAYIDKNLEHKMEGSAFATGFLSGQVVDLSNKLTKAEGELHEFRKKKQLLEIGLDDKQSMTRQNLQIFNQKLAEVRAKRLELEASRKLTLAARDNVAEQEGLPDIRQNPVLQQIRVTYADLQKEAAKLEATYGEKHHNIVTIQKQIESVRQSYVAEIGKILKSLENQWKAVAENEKSLMAVMEQEKRNALEIAKLEVEYKPKAREAENLGKLYQLVTQREKETGLAGLIKSNNVRILDAAMPVPSPVKPRMMLNLAVALALGLALGLAAAFLIEALDNTLKTQAHTEAVLGVPVLGIVPIIGEKADKKLTPETLRVRDLGVFLDSKSAAAEACRSIRTNLMFLLPDRPFKSLVVTSPGPQEGKTTTAISMAITMAASGVRVLLVDTDLRRPRIHRSFSLPNDVGVSNVIVQEI